MAASMKDERNAGCEWLYPDLLTHSDLLCILKQRYIKEDDLESKDKEYLIELFYKYVIPKPQRKYRLNRRGKVMTKKQIIMAKKRKITSPDDGEPPEKKSAVDGSNSRFITSFKDPSSHDRLKPPPSSCINFERKKIKLSSSSSSSASSSSSKLTGETDKITNDITSSIKTVKIKSDNNQSSQDANNPSMTMKKTIKLINRHIGTSPEVKPKSEKVTFPEVKPKKEKVTMEEGTKTASSKSNDVTEEKETKMETETTEKVEEAPKKKIKIKRISWP